MASTAVHSAARKLVAVAVAYAGARLGLDAETQAAALALALAVLQAWSVHDDRAIAHARDAEIEAVRAEIRALKQNTTHGQAAGDPRTGSRVGPGAAITPHSGDTP